MDHKPFLDRTNMIGNTIGDAWKHNTITNRKQFKSAVMRRCYGSTMEPHRMWSSMNIDYTMNDSALVLEELEIGEFSVANRFKDFIIQNVNPKPEMNIKIGNDEFKIECNRFYNVGDVTNKFDFYDTYTNSIRRIHNTETIKKPDLKQFKRYFVTLIVHNEDSQVENNTTDAVYDAYKWVIDIHDALILDCEAEDYAKDIFCSGRTPDEPSLENIHRNRKEILGKYFTSIGIGKTKEARWKEDVAPYVEHYGKKLKCNRIVLK